MASESDDIIREAAELVKARSPLDAALSAPGSWRAIGLDLQYPAQLVVRLRPAGDGEVDVEIFTFGNLLASERLRKYRSAERLAEQVEDVHHRALDRD